MNNYTQMQTRSVDAATPAAEQMVQSQLQSVVENLGWAYVALWSLNRQTRILGWKGGHFRVNSSAGTSHGHGGSEVWNEQFFNFTYKSFHITGNLGSVRTAHAEGRNIWMNGPSVFKHAGSKEQAEFLQHARISTMVCIPWTDGVLELGTCESVPENVKLMENIRQFVLERIVPALQEVPSSHDSLIGVSQAPPSNFLQSFPAPRSMEQQNGPYAPLSADLSSPTFEPNSLNQQIKRAASLSSLNTDIFLQHLEEGKDQASAAGGGNNDMDADTLLAHGPDSSTWSRLPPPTTVTTTTSRGASDQAIPISATVAAPNPAFQYYPPAQQTARGHYRSRTSTTSSSVSSFEDGSGSRHSTVDSPEQTNMTTTFRGSRSTTSSSPTRGASSHSPELNQIEEVPVTKAPASNLQESARVDDDIQTAISLMLAEGDDQESQWPNLYASPLEANNVMSQLELLEPNSSTTTNGSHTTSSSRLLINSHHNTVQPHNVNTQAGAQITSSIGTANTGVQSQGLFKSWRHTRILAPILRKDNRTNQELLRRCIDMMKQIPNLQQGAAQTHQTQNNSSVQQQQTVIPSSGPSAGPSSSSPETSVPDIGIAHDPFDQPGPPRVQRRPRGGSRIASMGPVHTGHDEAAMNHMMAERRRRVKQKENFTALRRLVPIISKADKASILGDAIVYLQDLQGQIKELEASRDAAQRRFEALQVSYKGLEDRNKELEAMASTVTVTQKHPGGSSSRDRLHSFQSF